MIEPGHAEDCPGCVWAVLTPDDRVALPGYRPDHERRKPPAAPVSPSVWRWGAWRRYKRALTPWLVELEAWRNEQWATWASRRNEGLRWPCPECAAPGCIAHHAVRRAQLSRDRRDTRLFAGMFDQT